MSKININNEYKLWLTELKNKIQQSQIKASISVNSEMILLYWDLGKQIVEKQQNAKWGTGFIEQLSNDLKTDFPDMKGFSRSNLFDMKKFYLFHNQYDKNVHQLDGQIENKIIHQLGGQSSMPLNLCCKIPWKHNVVIIEKTSNYEEALFYICETIENNWSRSVLEMQIETKLYERQGKSINNFTVTLPKPQYDLANQLLKDPYNFEFLTLE
jgi:predicted nuclease of restriction endonuclease-like (RecB) superfamily